MGKLSTEKKEGGGKQCQLKNYRYAAATGSVQQTSNTEMRSSVLLGQERLLPISCFL